MAVSYPSGSIVWCIVLYKPDIPLMAVSYPSGSIVWCIVSLVLYKPDIPLMAVSYPSGSMVYSEPWAWRPPHGCEFTVVVGGGIALCGV